MLCKRQRQNENVDRKKVLGSEDLLDLVMSFVALDWTTFRRLRCVCRAWHRSSVRWQLFLRLRVRDAGDVRALRGLKKLRRLDALQGGLVGAHHLEELFRDGLRLRCLSLNSCGFVWRLNWLELLSSTLQCLQLENAPRSRLLSSFLLGPALALLPNLRCLNLGTAVFPVNTKTKTPLLHSLRCARFKSEESSSMSWESLLPNLRRLELTGLRLPPSLPKNLEHLALPRMLTLHQWRTCLGAEVEQQEGPQNQKNQKNLLTSLECHIAWTQKYRLESLAHLPRLRILHLHTSSSFRVSLEWLTCYQIEHLTFIAPAAQAPLDLGPLHRFRGLVSLVVVCHDVYLPTKENPDLFLASLQKLELRTVETLDKVTINWLVLLSRRPRLRHLTFTAAENIRSLFFRRGPDELVLHLLHTTKLHPQHRGYLRDFCFH